MSKADKTLWLVIIVLALLCAWSIAHANKKIKELDASIGSDEKSLPVRGTAVVNIIAAISRGVHGMALVN